MVYDATITTEDEVDVMSGENVDATGATADRKAALVKQAEAFLSSLLKFDLTGGYSGLAANKKLIFNEYGARYAGMQLIMFNTLGFASDEEAANMVNVHWARLIAIEKLLEKDGIQHFQGT